MIKRAQILYFGLLVFILGCAKNPHTETITFLDSFEGNETKILVRTNNSSNRIGENEAMKKVYETVLFYGGNTVNGKRKNPLIGESTNISKEELLSELYDAGILQSATNKVEMGSDMKISNNLKISSEFVVHLNIRLIRDYLIKKGYARGFGY